MPQSAKSIWWGPPQKYDDRPDERKISWLELFYDLVYVAVIAQFSEHLQGQPRWTDLGPFLLLFGLVFWSWINGSNYHDLHGNLGIRTRFFTLLQMLAVASVAITIKAAFAGQHQSFVLSFMLVQAIITYLWLSTGFYDPSHRPLSRPYILTYSLALLLLGASFFVPLGQAEVLWTIALFVNFTPVFLSVGVLKRELARRGRPYRTSAAMVERFGLFTIIVLCESILGIINGTAAIMAKTPLVWAGFVLGVLIIFLLWWIYFDMLGDRTTRSGYRYMILLNMLHIPLVAAFVLLGSAGRGLLANLTGLNPELRWIFAVMTAVIVFGIVALACLMEYAQSYHSLIRFLVRILLMTGGICLLTPLICRGLSTLIFLAVMAVVLVVPILLGTWFRGSKVSLQNQPEALTEPGLNE